VVATPLVAIAPPLEGALDPAEAPLTGLVPLVAEPAALDPEDAP
jgi:hypothetical protein